MLAVETIGRIRREHFIKGKTIKEIVFAEARPDSRISLGSNTETRAFARLKTIETRLNSEDACAFEAREHQWPDWIIFLWSIVRRYVSRHCTKCTIEMRI
jgi:hypothetical protein